jgi:hypothetical protein
MAESSATTPASKEAVETSYETAQAGIELKLVDDIREWRQMAERRPPYLYDGAVSMNWEHIITLDLWGRVCAYLEAEIGNFSDRLFFEKNKSGADAVLELRTHVDQLIDAVRKYKWEPELARAGVEDLSMNWPERNCFDELAGRYERAFWRLQGDHQVPASVEHDQDRDISIAERKAERRRLRDAYRAECCHAGIKVTDVSISEKANPKWTTRDPVQKWLACDPRYEGKADRLIRRVFIEKPHLRKK